MSVKWLPALGPLLCWNCLPAGWFYNCQPGTPVCRQAAKPDHFNNGEDKNTYINAGTDSISVVENADGE
jgi:hypothetical protein